MRFPSGNKRCGLTRLLPLIYDWLRNPAANHLGRESPDHPLHPPGLASVGLSCGWKVKQAVKWQTCAHFLGGFSSGKRLIYKK
jgi:hypothetical protein